jgi:hypothetical protein
LQLLYDFGCRRGDLFRNPWLRIAQLLQPSDRFQPLFIPCPMKPPAFRGRPCEQWLCPTVIPTSKVHQVDEILTFDLSDFKCYYLMRAETLGGFVVSLPSFPGLRSAARDSNANLFKTAKLVARDGIEPPTPAFSGLRSTN